MFKVTDAFNPHHHYYDYDDYYYYYDYDDDDDDDYYYYYYYTSTETPEGQPLEDDAPNREGHLRILTCQLSGANAQNRGLCVQTTSNSIVGGHGALRC